MAAAESHFLLPKEKSFFHPKKEASGKISHNILHITAGLGWVRTVCVTLCQEVKRGSEIFDVEKKTGHRVVAHHHLSLSLVGILGGYVEEEKIKGGILLEISSKFY